MNGEPTVSLVVVNYNAAGHLRSCLDSVAALDYPKERLETIVVDNGSTDGSVALLEGDYPWVRIVRLSENVGFAGGVNAGAETATGECLALCNNDMRLEASWLRELVRSYDPQRGFACIAGTILDWEGESIDFAGGWINFHGAAGQEHFGEPLASVSLQDGRELPFACGGSMLIERELYLRLGGFDPAFFALVEDVDLGWRLWLAGHRVRLAAHARCLHRHSSTTGALPTAERLFLSERNALRMLLKNLDDENLAPVLAAALSLIAARTALDASGDDQAAALAPVQAVTAVLGDLDAVLEERKRVQALRRRSDREIFVLFGNPLIAVRADDEYLEAAARVTRAFGLDALFDADVGRTERAARRPEPTEPLGQLLAKWRQEYGVDRSAAWHLRRTIWRALPRALRARIGRRVGREA